MKPIQINLWTSTRCGYCPAAKRLAEKLAEKFSAVKLTVREVEDDPAGAEEAKLSAVPTWIITNGTEGRRIAGVSSMKQLSEAIASLAV